ncbi:UDP-N-acetylmuramoyl-L-alanine--D-glutamate ligase [Wolbachia endosymbiont of Chironomus riparius]|uniref:UDP-N-acetylmuramoyl-L-alanine--D-glutamate ligase n=1 Tax=Wolbachia endosymbiont of Chironomus riparius TaxID=2883238 RepID=UPI00209CC70B|nr:UDP-N-acetylmuramoyl-L-alanine--D-glutamate ligase [Wolbachia endosymbiont of Chironomus riparius]
MINQKKYHNKNIVVFGLGKTGFSVINFLINNKANVYAWDDDEEQVLKASKLYTKCNFIHPKEYDWNKINLLIASPGLNLKEHWIAKLAKCKIKSDIELFFDTLTPKQKVVGVTGTNGKSTTTSLIGHILKCAGKKVEIGGNLGNPVLNLSINEEIYIIELSSFQLELIHKINLDVGVLLNITPDHIDRHRSMENYIKIKSKLVQGSRTAVVSYDSKITSKIYDNFSGNKVPISRKILVKNGISYICNDLFDHGKHVHINNATINLISNAENIAAAYAVCKLLKINKETIVNGIKSFSGLKHRNELLGKIKNVLFVNDSKATNAQATQKALLSYNNIYWIVGGKSKIEGIKPLIKFFSRVKKAFLIGESAESFESIVKDKIDFEKCNNLKQAFRLAYNEAFNCEESITILLSPACASFDQWKNFEERGEAFRKMFKNLNNQIRIAYKAYMECKNEGR